MKKSTILFIINHFKTAISACEAENNSEGAASLKAYLDDFTANMGECFCLTETARIKCEQKIKEYFTLPPGLPQVEFLNHQRENAKGNDVERSMVAKVLLTILSPM